MDVYYIDGQFCAADRAVVPADDLAIARGYGVFDFLRTYRGKPFFLDQHLKRLQRSAQQIGIQLPWQLTKLRDIVLETLRRNNHSESNIRIVVTGGSSADFTTYEGRPRLMVMVTPIIRLPQQWYANGVKIITVEVERFLPTAKSINYIPAIMALEDARQQGAVEAVYVDQAGGILEGTTSNLFIYTGGKLVTAASQVLPGVTRRVVMDLIEGHWELDSRPVQMSELLLAEEAFLTSSNKEILPVTRVNETEIGDGQPGPNTRRLMQLFRDFTDHYALQN